MTLSEDDVTKAIERYLQENEFKLEVVTLGRKPGVDIKARKAGKIYYFENEGNQKPSKAPLKTNQKYTHLLRCVGQICLRMKDEGEYYIGLAEDEYYRHYINEELTNALQKLKVKIAWVQDDSTVNVEEP